MKLLDNAVHVLSTMANYFIDLGLALYETWRRT